MGFLSGKKALITGIASKRSIAYGIAQSMAREGAELALTYQNEKLKPRVENIAEQLGSNICIELDVAREEKLSHIKESITLSIIGCVVNGPGEASQTKIGLTGGGKKQHMLYLSGVPHKKVASSKIIKEIVSLVEKKSEELRNN